MTGCELIRDRGDLRHFQRLFSSFDPDAKQEINIVTFFEEIYLLMTKNKVCDGSAAVRGHCFLVCVRVCVMVTKHVTIVRSFHGYSLSSLSLPLPPSLSLSLSRSLYL